MTVSVFISGCGDIGARVAKLWLDRGVAVFGLAHNASANARLAALNIKPVAGDLDNPTSLDKLPTGNALVYHFAPPPPHGNEDPRVINLLNAMRGQHKPKKIVLISTTAVYGDCHGAWITEATPAHPQTDRGRRRLAGEQALLQWCGRHKVAAVILRVGGIYGPGRLPVERLEKGLPVLHESDSPYTNRIHQDDLASICVAAAERANDGAIYNVSDGQPGTMTQYFKDVAHALELPAPPEVDRQTAEKTLSAGMLSYLNESRRINNEKLIKELQIKLQYPNLAAGLATLSK